MSAPPHTPARFSPRRFAPWVLTSALVLALAGCGGGAATPTGEPLHATQELVRNNGSEPDSLDPALSGSVAGNNVVREMFEGLTATNASGEIVPGVAESWEQVNPTTWVFKLRKNACWSNGDPVTADDFVYGIRRFLDPKTASANVSTFGVFLLNGMAASQGKTPLADVGVKAPDAHTLEIKTPFPVGFLPEVVSNAPLGPVHKATVEQHGANWTSPGKLVGNGAFVMKDGQTSGKIVLAKSPTYWDAAQVRLTQITYLAVEDSDTDVKMLLAGENDWVYQLPPGSYATYKKQYPDEIHNTPLLGLRYYSLNHNDPLLKDVRVRKALSMVIDRDILAERVTADGQAPAYGVVVEGVAGADPPTYDWASWPMDKRVAEAKKLLEAAGVAPGTKLNFIYNTSDYHKAMGVFAASEWREKLELDTDLEALEFNALVKRRNEGDYQVARNGWTADYNDATSFLTLVQCDSDQNAQKNCNREAERLINEGNQSTDPAQRKALLTQAAKLIMDDYPMIPLLQHTVPRLVKSYVGGYSTHNPLDRYRGKDLYIIKH